MKINNREINTMKEAYDYLLIVLYYEPYNTYYNQNTDDIDVYSVHDDRSWILKNLQDVANFIWSL